MRCLLFVYIVDVDDASEEKVVISEQHWEWFVCLFCFCLITLIKVAICSFSFFVFVTHLIFFSLAKTEIIVFKIVFVF